MSEEIDYANIDLIFSHGVDLGSRTIYLSDNYDEEGSDEIDSRSTEKLFKAIKALESISSDHITIILNTSGGDTFQGMAMYDIIRNSKCKVTIKVCGTAHSMGPIILQAADKRVMTLHSSLMLHYGQTVIDAESDNVRRWQEEYERQERIMENILYSKVKRKLTRKELREMMKFDTFLDADKALSYGLVDEIEQ